MGLLSFIADLFKKLFQNPLIVFIYSIISQWYLIIAVGSIIVTYWVFKGLQDNGILSSAQNILVQVVNESKAVAQNCTPRITNLKDFWGCLSSPGVYKPNSNDQDLQDVIGGAVNAPLNQQSPQKVNNKNATRYSQ